MDNRPSPFSPGRPVPVDQFVGRQEQIKKIEYTLRKSASGRLENVFLLGERGIGKSSLASFIRTLAEKRNFLGIHVNLLNSKDLTDVVGLISEEIYKQSSKEKFASSVKAVFGKLIKEVDLFGVKVEFNASKSDAEYMVRNFPKFLDTVYNKIKEEKDGLFIALDDINGLSKTPEFANWYKSFVDYIATNNMNLPIFIMLEGIPEIRNSLYDFQESLMRIFDVIEVTNLKKEDVSEFFIQTFSSEGISVDQSALDAMIKFSNGLPIVMQEIGDAVFYLTEDRRITSNEAYKGVFEAAKNIGKKYLNPKVFQTLRSEKYRKILEVIGKKMTMKFTTQELNKELEEPEKNVLKNFLSKMKDLGIIFPDSEGERGSYKFENHLYLVYIMLQAYTST